jgi:hypothetical protein
MLINACSTLSLHQHSRNKPAQTSSRMTRPALQFLQLFPLLPTLKDLLPAPLLQATLAQLAHPTKEPLRLRVSTSAPIPAVQLPQAHRTKQAQSPPHPTSTASLPAKLSARLTPHASRKSSHATIISQLLTSSQLRIRNHDLWRCSSLPAVLSSRCFCPRSYKWTELRCL